MTTLLKTGSKRNQNVQEINCTCALGTSCFHAVEGTGSPGVEERWRETAPSSPVGMYEGKPVFVCAYVCMRALCILSGCCSCDTWWQLVKSVGLITTFRHNTTSHLWLTDVLFRERRKHLKRREEGQELARGIVLTPFYTVCVILRVNHRTAVQENAGTYFTGYNLPYRLNMKHKRRYFWSIVAANNFLFFANLC